MMIRYHSKAEICYINKKQVKKFGGNYVPPNNLLNEHALDYLVEIVAAEMFGESMYPTVQDKAGVYLFNIISNHIFSDGNKRTGLDCCVFRTKRIQTFFKSNQPRSHSIYFGSGIGYAYTF